MKFNTNEGYIDRIIRLVVGALSLIASIVLLIVLDNPQSWIFFAVFGVIAIVLLVTGVTGFCALYSLLGISTAKKKIKEESKNQ